MPHFRPRQAASRLKKLASFWPAIGVVGLRQVGKTTFLEKQVRFHSSASLDHDSTRGDAENSAVSFLSKLETPALVDEIQKVPKLFDALKLLVHKNRKPGQFFVTGSASFSEGSGIRESLTGRMGVLHLFPLNISEALEMEPPELPTLKIKDGWVPRISLQDFSKAMVRGGVPIPMFLRDPSQIELFWNGWLNTSILRDLARLMGKGFEADFAFSLLEQMGKALREGELPTTAHFQASSSRRLNRYLLGLESIFIIRRISCHELGTGKEIWLPTDSGLASYLMKEVQSEGATLSLSRLTLLNELFSHHENSGARFFVRYFKSAKGTPVDMILDNTPIRVVPLADVGRGPWGWHEKSVLGAMKKLKSKRGILLAPVDRAHVQETGISILPWTVWS
ncbi:AAA family ATPase [Bdellovibrionota bacterium FG-1]